MSKTRDSGIMQIMSVSTIKQMKLGRELAKDLKSLKKPRNKMQLMVASGYSETHARHSPHVVFKQPGTINAINVALEQEGFTTENAKRVVQNILNQAHAENKDRLKAAELIFKVEGAYAAEKSINLDVTADELKSMINDGLSRFRGEA
jgi:hypothetical protein